MQRVCLLGLVVLGLLSCGGKTKGADGALSAKWNAPAMLTNVPADTPYLIGTIDPIPQSFRDRMFALADQRLQEVLALLDDLPQDFDRAELPPYIRAAFVILDELRGKDMKHWGKHLGFHESGRFVVYGLSVWPVMRVSIADAPKMRRIIKKMIAAAGMPIEEGALGGKAYWKYSTPYAVAIAAVLDDELVVAIVPTAAEQTAVPLVLGIEKPARSLAQTNTLPALMGQYGLLPAMVGYFDIRAGANIITQRTQSSLPALEKPLATAAGPISKACRAEVDRLVSLVPRIAIGYRKLDASGMHFRMVAETPDAVTEALGRLKVPAPQVTVGLGGHPLFSFGVAARLDEAVPLLRGVAKQVVAQPFACSWFEPLNSAASELLSALEKPLPPALQGLRGLSFVLDDFTKEPMAATGHAFVVGPRAREAVEMVLKFVPGMGGVKVPADGRAVSLPLALFGMPKEITAHAAAKGERAGIAIGSSSSVRIDEVLALPTPKSSPLMSFGMDSNRLREMGLLDENSDRSWMDMKDIVMQLDVASEGLVLEMYGTFPPE